jgi:hypothetical protein
MLVQGELGDYKYKFALGKSTGYIPRLIGNVNKRDNILVLDLQNILEAE